MLEAFLKVLKEQHLLDQVNITGAKLKKGILELEQEFPSLLNSTRGRGTFLAVNSETTKLRDEILARLKKKGEFKFLLMQFLKMHYFQVL